MPFSFDTHAGDGASRLPLEPGALVITAYVSASDVEPGPELPLVLSRVSAGFPSPADDYVEGHLDMHELTNALSPSCYWMRAEGESMVGASILSGDLLLVDRAIEPSHGDVVVASVDGELTVKRFSRRGGRTTLLAANPSYPPIELHGGPGAGDLGRGDVRAAQRAPGATVDDVRRPSETDPPSTTEERPRRLFALVDCSAFYCSCERVFDPSLEGVPVAVLSNNDGCVIARSQEVKDLGIPMGAPFFKVKDELATAGVQVFSSNYGLYGDMSRRVMATLETVTPDIEVYSVDEAFLSVPTPDGTPLEVCTEMERRAREIRARVLRWTGIPVRVSWAETKTLAKAASEWAKVKLKAGGEPCVCLWGHPEREAWLESMAVGDVWGVGRRWSKKLEALGATTAADLARLPSAVVRQRFNVVLARTAMELGGVACLALEDAPVRKTLVKSRSFGEPVSSLTPLSHAVATHAARAAEKLRREGLVAGHIEAFISTKSYGNGPHRSAAQGEMLSESTSDTTALVAAARRCLSRGFVQACPRGRPYRYRKAGVTLSEIRPAGTEQRGLFPIGQVQTTADRVRQEALMAALDAANSRFGKRAVVVASQGCPSTLRRTRDGSDGAPTWEMRRERMSPRYTTRWEELRTVHIG